MSSKLSGRYLTTGLPRHSSSSTPASGEQNILSLVYIKQICCQQICNVLWEDGCVNESMQFSLYDLASTDNTVELALDVSEVTQCEVEASWNVMTHSQKPDFFFQQNGRVRLNWQRCQFCRLPAAEVWASAVTMLDTPCSEVVWRALATHSIHQFPLQFPSRPSSCAITFQLGSAMFLL